MTQAELARATGMSQNNLSRLENPEYGKHTISSLKRIANALDVALVVRFVPFSQYIDWLSGTPYWDRGLRPEALGVPSFPQEEERHHFDDIVAQYVPNVAAQPIPVATATATIDVETPAQGLSPEMLYVEGLIYPATFLGMPTAASETVVV
jgi:transcriptional regulator with XRE-family HTH domain